MHSLLPKGLNLVNGRYFFNVANYGAACKKPKQDSSSSEKKEMSNYGSFHRARQTGG
jgi:hypothetical protein